jgi:hypothetical protein
VLEGFLVKLPILSKCRDANERVGVIHVHTRASDGSGTVAEVMAAAEKANLSFIAITDHNVAMTQSDLAEDPPDLPIISGVEVGTTAGHFLALGIPPSWVQPKTTDDRTLLAAARAAAPSGFSPIHFIPILPGPTGRRLISTAWRSGTKTPPGAKIISLTLWMRCFFMEKTTSSRS